MRRYCKVKPSGVDCHYCSVTQDEEHVILDCEISCPHSMMVYELLGFGTGIFGGGYAFVSRNGNVYKVAIDRIFDLNVEV